MSGDPLWQTNTTFSSAYCQEIVDRFSGLINSLDLPDHLTEGENVEKTDQDFDVNQYFTILDRLNMEPGYVLDYVYFNEFMGGEPVIYARKTDQRAFRNYVEFSKANPAASPLDEEAFLNHIQTDGTPEGFFQFALLRIMGGQFYLSWHANYDDERIICDSSRVSPDLADLGGMINGSTDPSLQRALMDARRLDFAPIVEMDESAVRVNVVVFTKWGGFLRRSLTLNREFPHEILRDDTQVLVPYDWGIVF